MQFNHISQRKASLLDCFFLWPKMLRSVSKKSRTDQVYFRGQSPLKFDLVHSLCQYLFRFLFERFPIKEIEKNYIEINRSLIVCFQKIVPVVHGAQRKNLKFFGIFLNYPQIIVLFFHLKRWLASNKRTFAEWELYPKGHLLSVFLQIF